MLDEMKVALYLRVSTLDQNPEAQRRELEAYATRHDWEIVQDYEDRCSGSDPRRPALRELLAAARSGKFQCVLVWKLDRFGRSLIHLLENLQTLDAEAVRFIAVRQGIDTDRNNPAGRFLLHILGAVAELERGLLRERVASGINRYWQDVKAGKVGRSVHSKSGKDLLPHRPKKIFDLEKARDLREQGLSLETIAHELGVSASTLCRRMRS